jgi:hypothetical protein
MKRLVTRKYDKYKTMYARAGVDFMPLAVEMHGAISDTFLKFLNKLASDGAVIIMLIVTYKILYNLQIKLLLASNFACS